MKESQAQVKSIKLLEKQLEDCQRRALKMAEDAGEVIGHLKRKCDRANKLEAAVQFVIDTTGDDKFALKKALADYREDSCK